MKLGDLELTPLSDGFLRLDGGAMFGVVPKPLWEKRAPADDRNRIRLGMRPLLVRGSTQTLIIDAGIGGKMDPKSIDIYGVDRARHLDHALADAGLSADEIELVLASHLHFDHAGGFTGRTAGTSFRASATRATWCGRGSGRMRPTRTRETGPATWQRISCLCATPACSIYSRMTDRLCPGSGSCGPGDIRCITRSS